MVFGKVASATFGKMNSHNDKINGDETGEPQERLVYYLKNPSNFAIKCQKALAMCAKAMYNNSAIL
jgi:hypothetical protein